MNLLAEHSQAMRAMQAQMAEVMMANARWQQMQAPRQKQWDDLEKLRMLKAFGGQRSEWE